MLNPRDIFREGANAPRQPGSSGGAVTAYQRIALLLFLVSLPFYGIWLFMLTAERGILSFDKFNQWPWRDASQFPKAARAGSEAHMNMIDVERQLWLLEMAGKDLWGEDHTWMIYGFKPDWTVADLEGVSVSPHFSKSLEAKSVTENLAEAEDVVANYVRIRIFYSQFKYEIERMYRETLGATSNLPADDALRRTHENLRTHAKSFQVMDTIERRKSQFATKIAPFFQEDKPPPANNHKWIFAILALASTVVVFVLLKKAKRIQNQTVVQV